MAPKNLRPLFFHFPPRVLAGSFAVCLVFVSSSGCVHYAPKPLAPLETAAALEARSLTDPQLQAFIAANSSGHAAVVGAWDLEALTLAAVYFNPTLAVARAQWRSAVAGKQTAADRPNPSVSVSVGYNQDAAAGMSPWMPGLSFDLPFEVAGKRNARVARAEASIESTRQSLLDTVWMTRRAVRTAWIDTLAVERRARIIEEQAAAQGRVAELLQQRLSVGTISLPEVTAARLARQRANYDAGEAHRLASAARSRLAEAIGVPLSTVRQLELQPLPDTPPPPLALATPEARTAALRHRPDVLVTLADYQGAEADLQSQIAKQYPDIHVGPGLLWDQGERKWTLGASFEIPLFNHNRGPIAEAEAHRDELAVRVLAAQARALAELDAAFENYAQVEAQLARARDVYQAAEDQRRVAEGSRNSGDSDALQAESAKLESLSAQLIQADTLNAWHAARGQVEDALHQPLPLFTAIEASPGREPSKP